MTETVLSVQQVSKLYRIFASPRQRLLHFLLPWVKSAYATHQALIDVTLTLARGEALAIVGANGAGKSTLLKLLAGISRPSSGHIAVHGSIGAIVELGLGFHSDFSGRDNARASLVMQGSSRRQVAQQLIDIQDFAELGDYFDRPVRTYSSGMQARLAFATATSTKPDILIVDEVLSVGDGYFQGKSIRRIEALMSGGTSLLFVSHDLAAVKRLCHRAILLDHGRLVADGSVSETLDRYNALLARPRKPTSSELATARNTEPSNWASGMVRSGDGQVQIQAVAITNAHDVPTAILVCGSAFCITVKARIMCDVDELCIGITIRDRLGQILYGTNTYHHSLLQRGLTKNDFAIASFMLRANLGEGQFLVSASAHRGAMHTEGNFDWLDNCASFDVLNAGRSQFIGLCDLDASVKVNVSAAAQNTEQAIGNPEACK